MRKVVAPVLAHKSAVIANAGTKSAAVDLGGLTLVGIHLPATFTGVALTFETCDTLTGTFQPLYNGSGQVSYTVAQARSYAIDPKDFYGVRYLKVVSGSSEAAERTMTLRLKGL